MSEFDKALKNVKCYMFWDAVDGQWLDFLHVPFGRITFDWLMGQLNDAHRSDVAKLDAENAKLRELVRDMWEGYNDPRCEECHLKDTPTCADCPICAKEAAVIDCMRELGVEL